MAEQNPTTVLYTVDFDTVSADLERSKRFYSTVGEPLERYRWHGLVSSAWWT
jgi:hypothetical protein